MQKEINCHVNLDDSYVTKVVNPFLGAANTSVAAKDISVAAKDAAVVAQQAAEAAWDAFDDKYLERKQQTL